MDQPARNLREHLDGLRARGELSEVTVEVDPRLEAPESARRGVAAPGPVSRFQDTPTAEEPFGTTISGAMRVPSGRANVQRGKGSNSKEAMHVAPSGCATSGT